MARTYGSYMIQPTKDELRTTIRQLRKERDAARAKIETLTEQFDETRAQLNEAYRILGRQRVAESLAEAEASS